jgi:hypothetical protein
MLQTLKLIVVVLVVAFIAGCGKTVMVKSSSNLIKPSNKSATIVFMRSSFVSGAIGAEVIEIDGDKMRFVGKLPNGTKIAHETSPGEKVYMIYGTAADFMIANVEAGKTYYVIARPNWGTGGFAPTPIRKTAPSKYNMQTVEFKEWKDDTELYVKNADADPWFTEKQPKFKEIYDNYWSRFQTKNRCAKARKNAESQ